jgi:hypothetical protein
MAINSADFQINSSGDIRRAASPATTTVYTVFELHEWLQDLADNAAAAGDDTLSILSANPSKIAGPRATNKPMSITLLNGFNVDDAAAQFFKYGSIEQENGAKLYTGVASIGSPLVAASPIYILQNAARLTSYWGAPGHIQVLVKAKASSAFIDNGDIRAFSRKWGQTFSDFPANLQAGSEQPVAIATSLDTNIGAVSKATALAYAAGITITVGDTTLDLGNGNGVKAYKGTIALNGTTTLLQAYQYLQAITSDGETGLINGVQGQFYRTLNVAYPANSAAPFGSFAGGKFFVAQGWKLTGVMASENTSYQLIDHAGATQSPPVSASITIGNLVIGDIVLVGRDSGTAIIMNEYTTSGTLTAGTALVVTPAIASDTPAAGFVRVNGVRYAYNSWTGSTFTLAANQTIANGLAAFVPFLDVVSTATTASVSFIYGSAFTARVKVRRGSGVEAIVPFETTLAVGAGASSVSVVRTLDV